MIVIETTRLHLRHLTADDAAFIVNLLNQPSFLKFIGDRGVKTRDDARNYIATGPLASYRTRGFGLYAVALKDKSATIGICGLMKKDWLPDPDLAYAFLPQYWSQGYAQEAAAAVLAENRRAGSSDRIVAVVTPDNAASMRLLGKLGFAVEETVAEPGTGTELLLLSYTEASVK